MSPRRDSASERRVLVDFAPPTEYETMELRRLLQSGEVAGIDLRVEDVGHGIPLELRLDWATRLHPEADIRTVRTDAEGTSATETPHDVVRLSPEGATEAEVRDDPLARWFDIPLEVRPDYLVRVAIVGPESVGKSTLAVRLAKHTGGSDVQEYARGAFPWGDPDYRARPEHMVEICRGHRRWLDEAKLTADRWLFSDTEALSTLAWSELYFGHVPAGVRGFVDSQEFDLFLLLDADVPWVSDGTRTWEDHRRPLHDRLRELLDELGLPWRPISGSWNERFERALETLDELGSPAAPRGVGPRFPGFPRRPASTSGTDPGTSG